ncbi:MAG: hypothetical protein Q8K67_06140 [Geothrix sp.]|nr:hypothetical protein [Geothrix sp.]
MNTRVLIPVILALLTACSVTMGRKIDPSELDQFKTGTATMAQVSEKLGQPKTIFKDSTDNSTDYQYHFIVAGMQTATGETYHFVFGPDGILIKKFVTQFEQRKG